MPFVRYTPNGLSEEGDDRTTTCPDLGAGIIPGGKTRENENGFRKNAWIICLGVLESQGLFLCQKTGGNQP